MTEHLAAKWFDFVPSANGEGLSRSRLTYSCNKFKKQGG